MNSLEVLYHSSWEVLPAIFDQILDGVEDVRSYAFQQYGKRQGSVVMRLVSDKNYRPTVASSGSLEIAFIADNVHRFVSNKFIQEYFGIDNHDLKVCLKKTFASILKGSKGQILASDEGAVLKLGYRGAQLHAVIEGNHTVQLVSLCKKVQAFMDGLGAEQYFGKLQNCGSF